MMKNNNIFKQKDSSIKFQVPWRLKDVLIVVLVLILLLMFTIQSTNSSEKNRMHHLLVNNQHSILIGSIGGHGGALAFWSLGSGRLEHLVDLGEKNWVSNMALSRDGDVIALTLFGDNDIDEIGTYSIKEKKWLWKKRWEWGFIASSPIQFLPDGKSFIVLGFERMVTFDAVTGAVLKNKKSPSQIYKGLHCLSPSGKYAAAWGPRRKHTEFGPPFNYLSRQWVFVFDVIQGNVILDTGKLLKPYKNCGGAFTPDQKHLVLGSMGGMVSVWSVEHANVVREWRAFGKDEVLPHMRDEAPYNIDSIVFSPDGRFVATQGIDKSFQVKVWDYSDNRLLMSFDEVTGIHGLCDNYPMAFAPDGKLFALEQRGRLCLYETDTWQEKWCVSSSAEGKD